MVVLRRACDVRGNVPTALEPPRHAALDLRFERAIDRREGETRMARAQTLVQLLCGHGLALSGKTLRHDQALVGQAPAARRDAPREMLAATERHDVSVVDPRLIIEYGSR